MMCLASGVLVEGLEVDGAAWLSVFLRTQPCGDTTLLVHLRVPVQ